MLKPNVISVVSIQILARSNNLPKQDSDNALKLAGVVRWVEILKKKTFVPAQLV
jgi:hypothetical protein